MLLKVYINVEEDLSNYFPPFAYSSHMLELPEWLGTFRPHITPRDEFI